MAKVRINNRDAFEAGIKKFMKLCKSEGILSDYGKKSFFMGGGEKRRAKSLKAAKRDARKKF